MPIQRMTFFRLTNPQTTVPHLLSLYATLRSTALKNGKPYILSSLAKPTIPNPSGTDNGYNFVAISVFEDMEGLMYYDQECEAHKTLKKGLGDGVEKPPLSVWVEVPGDGTAIGKF